MRFLVWYLLLCSVTAKAATIRFDETMLGKIPAGWTIAMTHVGAAPRWEVIRDETAPHPPYVLAQISRDMTAGRFPLAIWNGATLQDGSVSVLFKAVEGTVDRAAGIVWRYQDPNNYYIVRANALENNVVLYKVENGMRASIAPKGLPSRAYGVKHQIPSGRWDKLQISFVSNRFTAFFNGERLFEAEDATFPSAGKIGLWTKADSVTYFDELMISRQTGMMP
jgi:hypothetical protein